MLNVWKKASCASVVGDRVDEIVRELLARDVADLHPRIEGLRVVADRVEQVGLAEARVAVDEERVVRLGRCFGDGDGGGVREAVGLADDEVVERVLRVQARLVAHGARLLHRRLDARGGRLIGELMVHDNAERGDLAAGLRETLHERNPQTLVDLGRGEVVGHIQVQRRAHHTGGHRQGEEAVQLRGDTVVICQDLEHLVPDRDVGVGRRGHGAPCGRGSESRLIGRPPCG